MKTSKPFSTIRYNTETFLTVKLTELVTRKVFEWWCMIEHLPEEDEKKKHWHIFIKPNGQYQTDSLKDFLSEYDPSNPEKPLSILPIMSSKWDDWYLYACHDSAYLLSKGQNRKYYYEISDFKTSDSDYLTYMSHMVNRAPYSKTQDFIDKIMCGQDLTSILASGQIPLQQVHSAIRLYEYLTSGITYRANKDGHEEVVPNLERLDECRDVKVYGKMPKLSK